MFDSIFNLLSPPQIGSEITVETQRNSSSSTSTTTTNSSLSDTDDPKLSPFLYDNVHTINLDDSDAQDIALRYVLGRVRDLESLLMKSINSNKLMDLEMTKLFKQNDALAAENLTLHESMATLKNENANLLKDVSVANDLMSLADCFVRMCDPRILLGSSTVVSFY